MGVMPTLLYANKMRVHLYIHIGDTQESPEMSGDARLTSPVLKNDFFFSDSWVIFFVIFWPFLAIF